MESFNIFCYATAGWLTIQAVPLIVSPRMIVALLSADIHQANSLEHYFARSLGLTLIPFAVMFLFMTGAIPLEEISSTPKAEEARRPSYTGPTLLLATFYHATIGFYSYARFTQPSTSQYTYLLAAIASGSLAAMGLWCVMFGGDSGHISKRTGADKRTSGWPFGNSTERKRKGKGKQVEGIELKDL